MEMKALWVRVGAIKKVNLHFRNFPPGNFQGGARCREGVLFRRPSPYINDGS